MVGNVLLMGSIIGKAAKYLINGFAVTPLPLPSRERELRPCTHN
jgi:hypothetical protein